MYVYIQRIITCTIVMPQKLMWHNIIRSTKSQNGFNFIYVINYKLAKSCVSQLFGIYYYRFGLCPDNSICCRWHCRARMASLHEDHANPISINRLCYSQI